MSRYQPPLDASNMADSIRALAAQCLQALKETAAVSIPESCGNAKQILLCGMGGSALAAHVVQRLHEDTLPVPLVISRDYLIPGWVNGETLVILSSYSGSTAETLAALRTAGERQAMLLGLTAGGPLGEALTNAGVPWYRIVPTHNPCGQPRMALGYALFGLLGLLWNAGILSDARGPSMALVARLESSLQRLDPGSEESPLPDFTSTLAGKGLVIVGSEHLEGSAHILANQLNENAKLQATWQSLPEVNHHLLEGLLHPPALKDLTAFVFLESRHYLAANQARYQVMRSILDSLGMAQVTWQPQGESRLAEVLLTLSMGSWLSLTLSESYGIDPSPIPYVNRFKQELQTLGF